jgi:hypothetical protein
MAKNIGNNMDRIFLLLILFQIKHFVSDFPLQNSYMLRKFLPDKKFILPLLAHVGVHGLFSFIISLIFTLNLQISLCIALVDMLIHFIMDRVKASPSMLGRYKTLTASEFPNATDKQKQDNRYFWWSLGLDQGVHHLTHYLLIYLILNN